MNESFYDFCNMVGDPAWVCFACLITGCIFGGATVMISGAADDLRNYFALKRAEAAVREAARKETEAPNE